MSEENLTISQPVTAEGLTFQFLKLSETLTPAKTAETAVEINRMLNELSPEQAMSVFSELHRQRNEIETDSINATTNPASELQSIVDTQLGRNSEQIESAANQLEAARVLAQAIQPELIRTQNTLLQETIGDIGSQRRINLTHINQAIGAVATRL